jgi:hypothetical protein
LSKADRNRQRAREKIAQAQALEAKRRRRRLSLSVAGGVVVVAAAATGIALAVSNGGGTPTGGPSSPHLKLAPLSTLGTLKSAPPPGPAGPEGVPIPSGAAALATTATKTTGQTVDGIKCQTNEQTIFHIHAHLTVFVNGVPRQIPAAIGIPGAQAQNTQGSFIASGTCFYWLHTHAADGIIHIESPIHRIYTLGNFFDEWGQPLGPNQVGPVTGHVTALYNGQVYKGKPRDIPLNAHARIQLEIGTPLVAPESITWPSGL